jgi:hypothetical protein
LSPRDHRDAINADRAHADLRLEGRARWKLLADMVCVDLVHCRKIAEIGHLDTVLPRRTGRYLDSTAG